MLIWWYINICCCETITFEKRMKKVVDLNGLNVIVFKSRLKRQRDNNHCSLKTERTKNVNV